MNWAPPNNAFERPVTRSIPARASALFILLRPRWRARRPLNASVRRRVPYRALPLVSLRATVAGCD